MASRRRRLVEAVRELAPVHLLILVLVVAPLAIGGVHLPVQIALAGLATAALVWRGLRLGKRGHALRLGYFGAALALLAAWTALQWVPLPASLVGTLSPASAQARHTVASLLSVASPGWHPLSLDGPATAGALVNLLGLLAVLVTAAHLDAFERHRVRLALIGAAGLVALSGVAHKLTGTTKILGVYLPSVPLSSQYFPTTLVNPNHAAALMLVAATVSFGVWLEQAGPQRRASYAWTALGLALATLATGSRANMALLVASLMAVGWFGWRHQAPRLSVPGQPSGITAALLGGAVIALAVVAGFASPRWIAEVTSLEGVGVDGVARWEVGRQVAAHHLGVGVGHGAFRFAAPAYIQTWDGGWVTYAHNMILQALADWGVAATVLASLLLLMGVLARALARPLTPGPASGLVALVALGVQNQVDFSLLIPGVGYGAAALAGCAVGELAAGARQPSFWHRGITLPIPRVAALTCPLVLGLASYDAVAHDRGRADASIRSALASGTPARLDLADILLKHPADFHLMIVASRDAAAQERYELATQLADRAVELAPREPSTLLARALIGLDQGDVEGALDALHRLSVLGNTPLRQATGLVLDHRDLPGLLEQYLLRDERHVLSTLGQVAASGRTEAALEITEWSLPHFPRSVAIREQLARFLLHHVREYPDELERLSVRMLAMSADEPHPRRSARLARAAWLVQGNLLRSKGHLFEAWHVFLAAEELDPERTWEPLLEQAATLIQMDGEWSRLLRTLSRLDTLEGALPHERARYHRLLSLVAERQGEERQAIREMHRALAYRDDANDRARLESLYEAAGIHPPTTSPRPAASGAGERR